MYNFGPRNSRIHCAVAEEHINYLPGVLDAEIYEAIEKEEGREREREKCFMMVLSHY